MTIAGRKACGCLCVFLLCLSSSGSSEIYKWRSEDGTVHYSDRSGDPEAEEISEEALPSVNGSVALQPGKVAPARKATRKTVKTSQKRRINCGKYEARIRKAQVQLRSGYSEPAGSRYRAQIREWDALLREHCR